MQIGQVGQPSSDYQTWLNAVDTALKSLNRGFGVSAIDNTTAFAAFQAGASPVIFARNVQPLPNPPPVHSPPALSARPIAPNPKIIRWTFVCLNFAGWAFWVIGGLCTLIALFYVLAAVVSGNVGVAGIALTGAVLNLFSAVSIFVTGSLWHYLAQKLAIAWIECRVYSP